MNIIKKLVLELDGKKVELSMSQARELFKSLEELFGQKIIREYQPYTAPYIPMVPYRGPKPYIWCSSNGTAPIANGTYTAHNSTLTLKA